MICAHNTSFVEFSRAQGGARKKNIKNNLIIIIYYNVSRAPLSTRNRWTARRVVLELIESLVVCIRVPDIVLLFLSLLLMFMVFLRSNNRKKKNVLPPPQLCLYPSAADTATAWIRKSHVAARHGDSKAVCPAPAAYIYIYRIKYI